MILNLNELTLEQSKLKAKLKKNVIADYNALTEQLIDYNRDSCLLYTSPSPRDTERSRMPSSA